MLSLENSHLEREGDDLILCLITQQADMSKTAFLKESALPKQNPSFILSFQHTQNMMPVLFYITSST